MANSLLQQGLDLMVFGMGTVFVFLTLLVAGTTIMSAVVSRYFPEVIDVAPNDKPVVSSPTVDARVLNIIKDAISQHRARK